ncbi:hypothetical protein PSCLAVI8L_130360 [Pseudoclavibacter sp. 8L]|nr:hypothetical protein PSCLAVI8L_130360 [Pseudoclavibacter sp. 8L]
MRGSCVAPFESGTHPARDGCSSQAGRMLPVEDARLADGRVAEEGRQLAWLRFCAEQVDGELVHRDGADDGARLPADEHRRGVRGAADDPVGVADADECELRRLRRDVAVPVGHALAGSDILHGQDLRAHAHRGPVGAIGEPEQGAARDPVGVHGVRVEQLRAQMRQGGAVEPRGDDEAVVSLAVECFSDAERTMAVGVGAQVGVARRLRTEESGRVLADRAEVDVDASAHRLGSLHVVPSLVVAGVVRLAPAVPGAAEARVGGAVVWEPRESPHPVYARRWPAAERGWAEITGTMTQKKDEDLGGEFRRRILSQTPLGARRARCGPETAGHVHRLDRLAWPHALPVGDHRQLSR